MLGPLLMLFILVLAPSLLFFLNYRKTSGKVLAFFLEENTRVRPELCSTIGDEWIVSKDGAYRLDSNKTRNVGYPTGWPRALQQVIPSLIYSRGDTEPLDWRKLNIEDRMSAREIGALLESEWLRALVKGIKEGSGGGMSKMERMVLFVGAGASAFSLVMIFVLLTRG